MIVQTYLYSIKVVVQLVDPAIFDTRNRRMYANPITVYQGIDNPVQVVVKNQDQKAVSVAAYTLLAEIQDPLNKVAVATYPVTWRDIERGKGLFVLDKETVNNLEQRFYTLTFRATNLDTGIDQPIYVDDNYGVPIDLKVLPAYYNTASGAGTTTNINAGDTVLDGGKA